MSTIKWRGDAPAVAQVDTLTVGGTIEVDDIFIVTINGKNVSVAAGSTVAGTVAATIQAALAASTIPEFLEVTWTVLSAVITGTGPATGSTAGKPITITCSTTEANGGAADSQTFVHAVATTASGPNHWIAANFSGGSLPANGDTVIIENTDVSILYSLGQSSVTLAALYVNQSFTGNIGLPVVNVDGSSHYFEYRNTYLAIGATALFIGQGDGTGSQRIKIDNGSVQTTLEVLNSGSSAENGLETILWKGTHSSNAVYVNKGSFAAAGLAGEVATIATLDVGYVTNQAGDATVRCGSGVTLTTVSQSGGDLKTNSNITTFTFNGGTCEHYAGTITTLNNYGGTFYYISTGTIATALVGGGATIDCSRDMRGRMITNLLKLYKGATVNDPFGTLTLSAGFQATGCKADDVTVDFGFNHTYTVA